MQKISLQSLATSACAVAVSMTLLAAPAAQAQEAAPTAGTAASSSISQLSSGSFLGMTPDQAWAKRNQLHQQIDGMNNPQLAPALKSTVDGAVNAIFPGLVNRKIAEIRAAEEAARKAAEEAAARKAAEEARQRAEAEAARRAAEERERAARFATGPCPKDADVCVDLDGRRTWLQDDNGNPYYWASSMAPGKPGPTTETPRGTFWVTYKVKDEISREFGDAPMPYAVYFTNVGHAFHMGNPAYMSAGCIRLPMADAQRYFADLHVGDKVFIY